MYKLLENVTVTKETLNEVFQKLDAEYGDITGNHIFEVNDDLDFGDTFNIIVLYKENEGYRVDWGFLQDLENDYGFIF